MDKSLMECPIGGVQISEESLRDHVKVEQRGVTGGFLMDSIAVAENKGTMCSHHNHGNTYNFIMMKQTNGLELTEEERSMYDDREKLVHHKTSAKKSKSVTLCMNCQQPANSSLDESSEDEFHDCVSTPDPQQPESKFELSLEKNCTRPPDGDHEHDEVRSSMEDIVDMVKHFSLADSETTQTAAKLGIQMRQRRSSEQSDICLNPNRSKCVPAGDYSPGTWWMVSNSREEWIVTLDLKNVSSQLRFMVKCNIEDVVQIARLFPNETKKIFFFLQTLYIENVLCSNLEQFRLGDEEQQSGETRFLQTDMRDITCQIIRSKTTENVNKIVYIAEVSTSALIEISHFLSTTLFALRKN